MHSATARAGWVSLSWMATCAGDEEVFLQQPEFTTRLHRIGRIQHLGNHFRGDLLLHRPQIVALLEDLHIEFIRGARREQPQVIDRPATVAHDRNIGRHANDDTPVDPAWYALAVIHVAINRHRTRFIRALDLPGRTVGAPEVGLFFLIAVVDFLSEEAVVVINAVPIAWHPERGQGVEEARCQTTESAIPEGWISLCLTQFLQI